MVVSFLAPQISLRSTATTAFGAQVSDGELRLIKKEPKKSRAMSQNLGRIFESGYAQYQRLVTLDTPAGKDRLVPLWVKGSARLGRDYEFIVEAAASREEKPIDARTLLGSGITLRIRQIDGTYLPIHGYVHDFAELGTDGSCVFYQLRFASWLYFLRLRRDQRDWLETTGEQILCDVFDAHDQATGNAFRFELQQPMPRYSYRMQSEFDLNFVYRSMEEAGVFGRFEFAPDGRSHTLIIMDDVFNAPPLPRSTVKLGRAGGEEEFDGFTSWRERLQLQSARLATHTFDYKCPDADKRTQATTAAPSSMPVDGEVYEHTGAYTWGAREDGERQARIRVEAWESQSQRFDAVGGLRAAMPGFSFTLDRGSLAANGTSDDNEFVILGVDWTIRNNVPSLDAYPAIEDSLSREIAARVASRPRGIVKHHDGSQGFFEVRVESQRRRVPFRLPREHHKPQMSLMNAIVDAPEGEEVQTDRLNRVKVRYPWYRDAKASCWLRTAFADAGSERGAVHPLRGGDEVLIDFVGGDCDRPLIVSRVFGGATEPVWHTNGLLSGLRSKEYQGTGFNQLVLDDSTGQNRVHLYSSSYQTHLHLGYLIHQERNTRGVFLGSGFDLKSDAYGALRAGQGLLVSTHPTSSEQPLDVTAAAEQLVGAKQVADIASKASTSNQAEGLDEGLKSLDRFAQATRYNRSGSAAGGRTAGGGTGAANGFGTPVMLLASPAGMGLSTQDSLQATANQHINVVSGETTHIAAGKSLLVSAMEKISLFVQNAGVKLFAAKGKVEIQAQGDAMALSALKDLTITSSNGRLVLSADKEIWIGAGGSYIRITSDMIENGTSGQILEKCASWDKPGASSMRVPATISSVDKGCSWQKAGAATDSASAVELD